MNPPIAKRVDARREHHGDVFVDPYEWLRDKSNPDVVATEREDKEKSGVYGVPV